MDHAHLLDESPEVSAALLEGWLREQAEPAYRGRQILEHVYERQILDPADMKNLPAPLRKKLGDQLLAQPLALECEQVSADGTRKFRFLLGDRKRIETVWIPAGERGTLCISSQAGCPARCTFCATGAGGFFRNLTAAEILAQWLHVTALLRRGDTGEISQIVFMGMGEPLLNYPALSLALGSLVSATGFRFSPRRITVSTVGLPTEMEQLMSEFPQVRLALSLHSAVPETRSKIVPMNRKYNLESLERVLMRPGHRARRVSLEYVLLKDVNDSAKEARALGEFAHRTAGHINLLPFHPFPGSPHLPLAARAMSSFRETVQSYFRGPVTIRKSRGLDIAGACGQLALLD